MNTSGRLALINASLERAAMQLGDITPQVSARFHAAVAEGKALFAELRPCGNPARLEGEMVEQILFCLMELPESPVEIEIIMLHSVPHHVTDLGVSMDVMACLIRAVGDTVGDLIPAGNRLERAVWQANCAELVELMEGIARHCTPSAANRAAGGASCPHHHAA